MLYQCLNKKYIQIDKCIQLQHQITQSINQYDVVFLDEKAIMYAKIIRQHSNAYIYCICSDYRYIHDLFVLHRCQIVLRHNLSSSVLLDQLKKIYTESKALCLQTCAGSISLKPHQIMKVCMKNKHVVNCSNGECYEGQFLCESDTKNCLLENHFICANRYDYINIDWIERIAGLTIELRNGEVIRILRHQKKNIVSVLQKYVSTQ